LDFFSAKISNNPWSKKDELVFWSEINAEHVGTASHLLDPDYKNDDIFKKAYDLHHEFPYVKEKAQTNQFYLELSRRFVEILDKFQSETKLKVEKRSIDSTINPNLANHDDRESKRALLVLDSLKL